jgi:hypothetical protein
MNNRQILSNVHSWEVASQISDAVCETILKAASAFEAWIGIEPESSNLSHNFLRNTGWKPSPFLWRLIGFHHVELSTVFIDPLSLSVETAIHELAHILDNRLGPHPLASIFGGGPSDEMARYIGLEPERFFPRFNALGYENYQKELGLELNPSDYGRTKGPAEDFAESFRFAVLQPDYLVSSAPRRFSWFEGWKKKLKDLAG